MGQFTIHQSIRCAVIFTVLAAGASVAAGADYYWHNGTGNTDVPTNWNPNGLPTAGDRIIFDDLASPGKYTVTFGPAVAKSDELRSVQSIQSLLFPSSHTTALMYVGYSSGDVATTAVGDGQLTAGRTYVGADGSTGKLTVWGVGTLFDQGSIGDDLYVGILGGDGEVVVQEGATMRVSDDILLAYSGAAHGELTVTGVETGGIDRRCWPKGATASSTSVGI